MPNNSSWLYTKFIFCVFSLLLLFVLHEKHTWFRGYFFFTWGLGSLYVICLNSYLDDFEVEEGDWWTFTTLIRNFYLIYYC